MENLHDAQIKRYSEIVYPKQFLTKLETYGSTEDFHNRLNEIISSNNKNGNKVESVSIIQYSDKNIAWMLVSYYD